MMLGHVTNKITALRGGELPGLTGMCLLGQNIVSVNSVDYLDEIFVKQNNLNTKQDYTGVFSWLAPRNIVFMDTHHKEYPATRKELSSAFFKNRLQTIT